MIRCMLSTAAVIALAVSSAFGQTGTFIDKDDATAIRLLDFNINWDSIFPDNDPQNHPFRDYNTRDAFMRIVAAVQPDIVCLQEINDSRNPQQLASLLDSIVPLPNGAVWKACKGTDDFIISRFDLSMSASDTIPTTNRDQAMALIDLPDDVYTHDLYLMNAHFKASGGNSNIARRQQHADAIINWIRDLRSPGGQITLPMDTPFMVVGDLNVYDTDPAHHLVTLLTGDIVDNGTYGPDIAPDWDSTTNSDALPRHNIVKPDFYTWRDDSGSFNPGALDRVIYSDSVMSIGKHFVLNTTTMNAADRNAAGLQMNDVVLDPSTGNYDHLPLVVDLLFETVEVMVPLDGDVTLDGLLDGRDVSLFVSMALGGPESSNATRIGHADFDDNNTIDTGDIPGFIAILLAN